MKTFLLLNLTSMGLQFALAAILALILPLALAVGLAKAASWLAFAWQVYCRVKGKWIVRQLTL